MKKVSKNKALGQYFSGELVARILAALSDCQPGQSIIDPMAGIGDMFIPFSLSDYRISAVEIDPVAYQKLVNTVPSAICANAFSEEALSSYKRKGYDLVITNPPYVRWQNLTDSSELPHYINIQAVYQNLLLYTESSMTLNCKEKNLIRECISDLSGLSDIAIPSWLLCMLLTRRSGILAIVVPNSWMSREYSLPIIRVFKELFDIEIILSDVNSVLFKGKALVQTNLIVARRNNGKTHPDNAIKFISAYKSLWNTRDCITKLKNSIRDNKSEKGVCEIRMVNQSGLWNLNGAPYLSSFELSSIKTLIPLSPCDISGISSYGIECFQGLRTGANSFFYLHRKKDSFISSDGHIISNAESKTFLLPTVQAQEDLGNTFSQGEVNESYLLYLQEAVISRDQGKEKQYNIVPQDLERYIIDSESRTVNDVLIPNLSAVRTNVRKGKPGVSPRFWYMLPVLSRRHTAPLFLPRLNSGRVCVRRNSLSQVIDANFVTIVIQDNSRISVNAALALLNSTWAAIQFEENCTVMGGGALKVDSVQMGRFFFPILTDKQLGELDVIGERALSQSFSDASIFEEIDRVIIRGIAGIKIDEVLLKMRCLLTDYINRRNAVR